MRGTSKSKSTQPRSETCCVTLYKYVSVQTNMFIRQQKIAAELGKPATAFVAPLSAAEGGGFELGDRFGISWHSPVTELPLCGHGTLAAAAVIFEEYGSRGANSSEQKNTHKLSLKDSCKH